MDGRATGLAEDEASPGVTLRPALGQAVGLRASRALWGMGGVREAGGVCFLIGMESTLPSGRG